MSAAPGTAALLSAAPFTDELAGHHGRRWSPAAARRYCHGLLAGRDPNLAAWLRLFDPARRDALAAVYAWARIADDFADEPAYAGLRARLLAGWRAQLERCLAGRAEHPVLVALGRARADFDLPLEPLFGVLAGLGREAGLERPADFAVLEALAGETTAPLGRLVLRLLGRQRPAEAAWAERLAVALRLTAWLQNLSRARRRGRLLLPAADLERLGLSEARLLAGRPEPGADELIRWQVARVRELYRRAEPLLTAAPPRALLPLASAWLAGRALLRMVDQAGAGVLARRPALSAARLARAMLGAGLERLPEVLS